MPPPAIPGAASPIACEADAVRRTAAGDAAAFEPIVTTHEIAVYCLLHRMTGSVEDAQDLTQETFLRAFRALHRFDAARPLRPWLMQIATNAARELRRRRGPTVVVPLHDEHEAAFQHPAEARESEQRRAILTRAVSELREEAAAIFHMHYREEMGVEAIAEVLGKRPNTIAVMLHRLRDQLRQIVAGSTNKEGMK